MKYIKLEARNDEWNRKFGFTDDENEGYLLEVKNGTAYFAWKFKGNDTRFYKCEEPVFQKHFAQLKTESVESSMDPHNAVFSRYPITG